MVKRTEWRMKGKGEEKGRKRGKEWERRMTEVVKGAKKRLGPRKEGKIKKDEGCKRKEGRRIKGVKGKEEEIKEKDKKKEEKWRLSEGKEGERKS